MRRDLIKSVYKRGYKMKKTVIKTAVITLISLIALSAVLITSLTVLAPRTLAGFFRNAGNVKMSSFYSELSYQKSGSEEDLTDAFSDFIALKNYDKIKKYGKDLSERSDFDEICERHKSASSLLKYKDYVLGNLAISMYETKENLQSIFEVCRKTTVISYQKNNAFESLLYGSSIDKSVEDLTTLKDELDALSEEYPTSSSLVKDIEYINDLLGN